MVTALRSIKIWARTDRGPFGGSINFSGGLVVFTARNSYGKSTAARAVAWCLGLEPMFGSKENDPTFLPLALREEVELGDGSSASVEASAASVTFVHTDGRLLRLTRQVKGEDLKTVDVEEISSEGAERRSRLNARTATMKDETGGLQHFLFSWFGWPPVDVATYDGGLTMLYLENLATLFYVEQEEGWSHLQARQVTRYRQQQIHQVAVEYALGSVSAVEARAARQQATMRASSLRDAAQTIEERFASICRRNGWVVRWSSAGSLADIISRWSAGSLRKALREDAALDLDHERKLLADRAQQLRTALTSEPIDSANASAHGAASQRLIEIKQRRHELAVEIGTVRLQWEEARELLDGLEHRLAAARDVLRLKRSGVGRLEVVECPTCHRFVDPASFSLTDHSEASVAAHIEALKRDRGLMRSNVKALKDRSAALEAESSRVQAEFLAAERDLMHVTAAAGTVREQLAKIVGELGATERRHDRLADVASEVDELQRAVDSWIQEASEARQMVAAPLDLAERLRAFEMSLRRYLVALGHSAVHEEDMREVHLDHDYVPMLRERKLFTLGSASDGPRVIAAYTLALAEAASRLGGFHPNLVILDEPLQQNPDTTHRALFLDFIRRASESDISFQVIVFTYLSPEELDQLGDARSVVEVPTDAFLLMPFPLSVDENGAAPAESDATHG